MKIPYIIVVIARDMAEKIPVEVHPHEAPILEQVHEGKAVEITDTPPTQQPREVDPIEEYDRMIAKYGDHPKAGIPFVERIYGRVDEFARTISKTAVTSGGADAEDDLDDEDEEQSGAGGASNALNPLTAELEGLNRDQLVLLARDLEIPGASQMNKATLVDEIMAKREVLLDEQSGAGGA